MGGGADTVLILAPHVDDEVLGCFAHLNKSAHVLYGGIEDRPSTAVRTQEMNAASAALGFGHSCLDRPVNAFAATDMIGRIERAIGELEPRKVLIPQPSYNQDHRAMFEAGMIATRPHDSNWAVSEVLLYEQPHSVAWPLERSEAPNVFVPIDIDAKLEAYALYESQVRGHRSPDVVRSLAALRGSQAGVPFAEGYSARRIVRSAGGGVS